MTNFRMALHSRPFVGQKLPRLAQNIVRDANLADIVKMRCKVQDLPRRHTFPPSSSAISATRWEWPKE
jgi:hypothetical protein